MALTGRLIALAALVLLAARIADLRLSREPSAAVRLGQRGETALGLVNGGRRRLRAIVRDAWVPSAGATPRLLPVDVRPGDRGRVATVLRPSRRGERVAAQVTVRSFGPLRVAARQRRVAVPGVLRVLPAFAARLRDRRRRARDRLAGDGTLTRRGGADVAARTRPAHRAGRRHGPDLCRPPRRRTPAGCGAGRLPAARRRRVPRSEEHTSE